MKIYVQLHQDCLLESQQYAPYVGLALFSDIVSLVTPTDDVTSENDQLSLMSCTVNTIHICLLVVIPPRYRVVTDV